MLDVFDGVVILFYGPQLQVFVRVFDVFDGPAGLFQGGVDEFR